MSSEIAKTEAGGEVASRSPIPPLPVGTPRKFAEMWFAAHVVALSGKVDDVQRPSEALAKMVAGAERGLAPMEAVNAYHFVEGKVTETYQHVASLIEESPRYDFAVKYSDAEKCTIAFYRRGDDGVMAERGEVTWTMQMAEQAKLVKDHPKSPWQAYPHRMLFARALTEGAGFHCPSVFRGPVMTPEEMGGDAEPEQLDRGAMSQLAAEAKAAEEEHAPPPVEVSMKAPSASTPAMPDDVGAPEPTMPGDDDASPTYEGLRDETGASDAVLLMLMGSLSIPAPMDGGAFSPAEASALRDAIAEHNDDAIAEHNDAGTGG